MAEEMRGALALQQELEKAKFRLKDVNENIKRITGRDPDEPRDRRTVGADGRGRERIFNAARRNMGGQDGSPVKRRISVGGAFSRLGPRPARPREDSGDEEDDQKHTVQSSVVAASIETRTKSMEKQSKDREGMARNRRMFGMILGTLQRFKTEAKDNKDKDDQRRKLEKKLDEKAEKERVRVRQETRNLLDEMRLEQSKIRRLEQKMELVQDHEAIEKEMVKLSNFLSTKSKPHIFYMPKKLLSSDDNKLKDSEIFVKKLIDEKQKKMESEIEEMMTRESQREERIRSRIAERARHASGDMEDHDDEDDDDHEDDQETDQQAIDKHKASMREDKENEVVVKSEPMSDFNVSGIKQEKDADGEGEGDDSDVEMGEEEDADGQAIVKDESSKRPKNEEGDKDKGKDGGLHENQDAEMQDGGMVNTVGGAAKEAQDKDSSKHSRRKSDSKRTDKHRDSREEEGRERHRTKSGQNETSSRSEREKRRSSDHHEREKRRSRSRDRKDRHKHSRHHKDEKRKRTRHDTDDEDNMDTSTSAKQKRDNQDERIPQPESESTVQTESTSASLPKDAKPSEKLSKEEFFEAMVSEDLSKSDPSRGSHTDRESHADQESQAERESHAERERKIVMAEDGEDNMEDEPADE
ncbi:hypothetical protein LOTGIDRAFT_235540 [Lottia gigantea]|uniref:Pinin n=1 Tax=Lottia gigantea TaxID=225164 RepID=V3ZYV7_LOTGI|nr:hypothetical protein LOTGIDRAFT_235540 [Lottia gigantea]ESO86176.1 hypothetical protein LOTGIDRAFT_235540 [Lottia gigantea]